MGEKSCLNCIHGSKVMNKDDCFIGFTNRLYHIQCAQREKVGELGSKYNWNELQMPKICGRYQPKIVERCAYCKNLINVAEYLWENWAGTNGKPVCSYDCRAKLEAEEIGSLFYD
jgi:hypothetical protein